MTTPGRELRIVDRPGGLEGLRLFEVLGRDGQPLPARVARVAVVGRQHGNEPVGEAVIERLRAAAEQELVAGSVLTVIANLDARALGVRHTPTGTDMNRLWDADTLARLAKADPAHLVSEERRVRELAPWLLGCDAVLDLHSTSRPSTPHVIFRDDLQHADLAARLGVRRLVTGVHENAVLQGAILGNLGLTPAEPSPRIGLTLEAGQHDDPANADAAWEVTVRLLRALGLWRGPAPARQDVEVYEILDRVSQAPAGTPPWTFVGYAGGPPGGGRAGPTRRLESFEGIDADEIVLRRATGESLRAESPFTMLMPSTVAGPGEDLYFMAQRRHTALAERPPDADTARSEAVAVERVLDLLAWDEAERGTLRVPLASRRTLDACAELVARTTRLPPGHPHRRLVIVGRGGGQGDAAEQRDTVRWRAAVRAAIDGGVPVERIQLLRGATLAGLERLADDARRGVTVRFSDRQPTSIALVVAGDPRLALAEGDLRHVAVALRIEAQSVEGDGDDAHVQIARAGLIASRPELLRAALAWVEVLRAEDARFSAELPPGVERFAAVRAWLVARWREALRGIEPAEREAGTLGGWLVRTIGRTGVLDVATLRAWVVRARPEGGHRIDPSGLDADPPPVAAASTPWRWPPPLHAREVDQDSIERWIGWRRWVGEVQAVPGTHGRDLEILVGTADVQGCIASWVDDVREAARAAPGRWLLAIAGNGQGELAPDDGPGWRMARAHSAALAEPGLHHLRVQHVRGTRLGWWKQLVERVVARPPGSAPVGLAWDAEHAGSVSVLVVGERAADAPVDVRSLEGWTIRRVLLLFGTGEGADRFQVALASSELGDHGANAQLVHFARVHLGRLLRHTSFWMSARPSPLLRVQLEGAVRALLAAQVAHASAEAAALAQRPEVERAAWVAARLGLADRAWAAAIVRGVLDGDAPEAVAARAWAGVSGWAAEPA